MLKPFRLINAFEIMEFENHFSQAMIDWNDKYSLNPLTIQLTQPPKEYFIAKGIMIHDENNPLAMIEEHYLSVVNQVLFGNNKPCFNSTSQELFFILLNQFLKVNHSKKVDSGQMEENWFYPGSTCLLLTLSCTSHNFTITLNPDWVYQNLSRAKSIKTNLSSLEEAVSNQHLTLNLELSPINLPLNHLISLKAGDVIATDHPIFSPLRLTQRKEFFAEAELGQSLQQKSIVLKESS